MHVERCHQPTIAPAGKVREANCRVVPSLRASLQNDGIGLEKSTAFSHPIKIKMQDQLLVIEVVCGQGAQFAVMARSLLEEESKYSARNRGNVSSDEGSLVNSTLLASAGTDYSSNISYSQPFTDLLNDDLNRLSIQFRFPI